MKRIIIKLFAVVMAVLTFSGLAWTQAWNHDPASPMGHFHWGAVTPSFATCGDSIKGQVGMKQSPIDIVPGNASAASFAPLLFKYKPTPLKIANTGHYVEVPYDPTSFLYVGTQMTDVYQLVQFHCHAPSEHTIIGVLLSSSAAGLPIFNTIMANSPTSPEEIELSGEVNVFDLLPFRKSFYRYAGSLTTPACSESVQWFLMQNPVLITPGALAKVHSIISMFPNYGGYANNNRPIANQNGRSVLTSNRNNN